MEVWRKGQAYVLMLDRKQCLLQNSLAKSENQLTQVKRMIALHLQEIEDINQQIKACMDLGLLSREYIYKSIREQGIFLTKKQLISNKITQLESEKYELEQQIQQSNTSIFSLKKKITS
ncbi:hypothetical protein SAMN05216516_11344 [Izhakiella capsodis]|uniref:Uncharacterized protein n=1 Tax=Izhakiella capsodis TaxID=1367852 RepID=A0A1I5AVP0_9GAMM|nr:type III secretion system protein [Izhakiella capsodis]SFN66514.1 hypothetical protein SAMN05216516_11344 [Izhakiella capsodis]